MSWVLICTFVAVLLANAPLAYILLRVHHPSGLSDLWGYAPNQFLFPLLAFPIAAFATFTAMKLLITTLQESPPQHPVIRGSINHWMVVTLIAVILTALVCIVDYFRSVKTFDKLQPVYAQRAVDAAKEVRRTIIQLPKADREEKRMQLIRTWRDEKEKVVGTLSSTADPQNLLMRLDPGVYLQIVQDPPLQLDLRIMNQATHALNVLQLFISLFTGFCMLFVTVLCLYVFKSEPSASQTPVFRKALSAVFFAVSFFALWPILYAQQRAELEYLVGTGYTILPHVFSGIAIIVLLLFLITLEPIKGHMADVITTRFIPILLIAAGFGVNLMESQPLRQLVGVDSNWGVQIMLLITFLVAWTIIGLHLWPWKNITMPNPCAPRIQTTTKSNVQ